MHSHGRKLAALSALLLLGATARGDEREPTNIERMAQLHREWVAAGKPQSGRLEHKFGIDGYEAVNVHAYDFQANTSSDLILDDGNGYRYFGAESVPYMAAPVQIPSGAAIVSIGLSYCSANVGDLAVGLFDNGVGGSGSGGGSLIALATSGGGCGSVTQTLAPYTYASNADHPLYLVVYFAGNPLDGTTKFNDVVVYIRRQVSPAPAQATFGDVPTSDPAFQFVEALVSSGITAGCGNGVNYCPDNFVTRRQMAVFLAKALGLHWPY